PVCARSNVIFVVGLNGFGTFWCSAVSFGNPSGDGGGTSVGFGSWTQLSGSTRSKIFLASVSCGVAGDPPNGSRMSNQPKPIQTVFHLSVAFLFMMMAPVPTVMPAAYLCVATDPPAVPAPS